MQIHKLREHKIINKKVNKDSQETNNIIRIEKNKLLINSYFGETSSKDLELGSEGLMCHAQPKDLRSRRK